MFENQYVAPYTTAEFVWLKISSLLIMSKGLPLVNLKRWVNECVFPQRDVRIYVPDE